jgi:hypothetical protein
MAANLIGHLTAKTLNIGEFTNKLPRRSQLAI